MWHLKSCKCKILIGFQKKVDFKPESIIKEEKRFIILEAIFYNEVVMYIYAPSNTASSYIKQKPME